MSMFGAAVGNALASLGGAGAAAAIVAGGLVVGALGGGLVATQGGGAGQPATSEGRLAVYGCPDSGEPLVMVPGGQRLLATGRSADGTWLRIHYPGAERPEAWILASPVQVDGAVASLPVAECMPELAIAAPSFAPAATLTVVGDNAPTPSPTPSATATPVPTPGPTSNPKPALSGLTASTRKISYDTGDYCPNAVKKVTFKVKATDTAGVDKVTLFWREPGAGSFAQATMTRAAGSAKNGTWQVTLDTTANGITKAGKLAYYAVATDSGGATRRIPAKGSDDITVAVCVNTGPAITNVASSAGKTLYSNPAGAAGCDPSTTNITAVVKDVDGVKGVTLVFRRPGSDAWSSKAMNDQTIRGKWYANLDTLGDKLSPGTLRWYIKATDGKGVGSRIDTRSITVKLCDTTPPNLKPYAPTPGVIGSAILAGVPNCSTTVVEIRTYAGDGQSGIKSVVGTLVNARSGAIIGSPRTLKLQSGSVYRTTFDAANGAIPEGYYVIRFTATNGVGLKATAESSRFQVVSCVIQ